MPHDIIARNGRLSKAQRLGSRSLQTYVATPSMPTHDVRHLVRAMVTRAMPQVPAPEARNPMMCSGPQQESRLVNDVVMRSPEHCTTDLIV